MVDLTQEEIRVLVFLAERGWEARGLVPDEHETAWSALAKLKEALKGTGEQK